MNPGFAEFLAPVATWMLDFWVAATLLMVAAQLAQYVIRQPVRRMSVSWLAVCGLASLLLTSAWAPWPRWSLRGTESSPLPAAVTGLTMSTSRGSTRVTAAASTTVKPIIAQPPTAVLSSRPLTDLREDSSEPPRRRTDDTWGGLRDTLPAAAWQWGTLIVLAGAMIVCGWELLGWCCLSRRLRTATPADVESQALLRELGPGMSGLRLLTHPAIRSPVACGCWFPTILLPQSPELADRTLLRGLLAHECARVRHGDLWLLALLRVLSPLLYAHPLYWMLRRQTRRDQELLADAAAGAHCGRYEYAQLLLEWTRQLPPARLRLSSVIGVLESPGHLSRRIAMLLDERNVTDLKVPLAWRRMLGLWGLLLVSGLSGITLRPVPRVLAADNPSAESPPQRVAETEIEPETDTALPAVTGQPSSPKLVPRNAALPVTIALGGRCVDEAGQPLEQVHLSLYFVNFDTGTQSVLEELETTATGAFQFQPIPLQERFATEHPIQTPQRKIVIVARRPGRAAAFQNLGLEAQWELPIELVLPPAVSLRGTVRDSQLKPVANAQVQVRIPLRHAVPGLLAATTDSAGQFEIGELAAWNREQAEAARKASRQSETSDEAMDRSYRGTGYVTHPDYAPTTFRVDTMPHTTEITLDSVATVDGTVVDGETGQPVSEVTINLQRNTSHGEYFASRQVVSSSEGQFRINDQLPPGTYRLVASKAGYPNTILDAFEVKPGPNVPSITMTQGGVIQGQLVEAATGRPLSSADDLVYLIMMVPLGGGHPGGGQAGEAPGGGDYVAVEPNGRFVITAPPGRLLLGVHQIRLSDSHQLHRWILDGAHRRAGHIVDVTRGQQTDLTLKLLRARDDRNSVAYDTISDEQEYVTELQHLLSRALSPATELPLAVESPAAESPAAKATSADANSSGASASGLSASRPSDSGAPVTEISAREVSARESSASETQRPEASPLARKPAKSQLAALSALKELGGTVRLEVRAGQEVPIELDMATKVVELPVAEQEQTEDTLFYASRLPTLQDLILLRGQITDSSLKHLSALPELQSLCLYDAWGLTDEGLAPVGALPKLRRFCVCNPELLTDAAFSQLAQAQTLEWIAAIGGPFTDAGLRDLARLPQLKTLMLSSATHGITDRGLLELARFPQLETLHLGNTAITNAGLKTVQTFRHLKEIHVEGSSVTEEGLRELRRLRPDLKVNP